MSTEKIITGRGRLFEDFVLNNNYKKAFIIYESNDGGVGMLAVFDPKDVVPTPFTVLREMAQSTLMDMAAAAKAPVVQTTLKPDGK